MNMYKIDKKTVARVMSVPDLIGALVPLTGFLIDKKGKR